MKKRKVLKIVLIVLAVFVMLDGVVSIILAGSMGGFGPFKFLKDNKVKKAAGNAEQYHLENVETIESSPLSGKQILFLGSSVTEGACALDVSMADYIGKKDNCIVIKEAVSGTTLSTEKKNSYIERLNKVSKDKSIDMVVCQLSTNDASQKLELGKIIETTNIDEFKTDTVTGAIEYIIAYSRQTWNCPVIFYTGTKYDNKRYQEMLDALLDTQEKWGIGVIDLWNDPDMNAVSEEDYKLYMYDSIHPTQAGYLLWWTPKIEEYLYTVTKQENEKL